MPRTLKRRRKEAKTDYRARLELLKSGETRLVIRKTNKYIIAQIVESDTAQDKVIFGITSRALLSKGWPEKMKGSLKNLTASYLTGFFIGSLTKSKVKSTILDIGMHRNIQKSRIYAFLKGTIDAGLKVKHSKEALPEKIEFQEGLDINKIKQEIQKNE